MADEVDDLLVKVKGDASGGVRALEETSAASEDMEKRVSKSTRKTGESVDATTKKTRKLAEESKKTAKSVASDFEKVTGSSKTAAAAFQLNFTKSRTAGEAYSKTIGELNAQVKTLGTLYSKTGDAKFLKRMQQADKDAKALTKTAQGLASTLGKDVAKGAESAGGALEGMMPVVASLVAAFAPLLGGALAGGVLGGVGLGGLALGIKGQLDSPLVMGALDQFKADLSSRFDDATAAFAPELRDVLGSLDNNLGPFWDSLKKGFTELAPYLKILGDGFARFMNEFGPGIEAAFKGAEPVLAIIAADLPQLGQALTVFFQQLEKGSTGAAESIGYIFQAIETAIVVTGYILRGLSNAVTMVTNGIIRTLDLLGHLPDALGGDKFRRAADNMRQFTTQAATATSQMPPLTGAIDMTNDALENQYRDLLQLNTAWNDAADAALGYDNAQLRLIEAGHALSKSIKENGRDWDMTHQKGRNNWHALLDNIAAAKALYDADVKVHGVTKDNTTAYQKSIDKLLAQAQAAGLSKDQISLLRQQFENLGGVLDKLQNRKVTFTVHGNVTGVLPGNHSAVASVFANSGVNTFANSGIAGAVPHYDATGVYSGRPGGLYRFAEGSTVREALIAKNGDPGRAASALREAASWQNAVVVSNDSSSTTHNTVTSSGGGGGDVTLYAIINIDGKPIARALVPVVARADARSGVSTLASRRP